MALSGKFDRKFYLDNFTMRVEWTAKQDTPANTSKITATMKLIASGSNSIYVSTRAGTYITIDGTKKTFTAKAVNISGGGTATLGTVTHTVNHDSSGNKSVAFNAKYDVNTQFSLAYVGSVSWSGSGTLDKITQKPNRPGSCSVSRVSDTSQKVTWTHTATTLRPVTRFRVSRWNIATGTWSVRGTTTSKSYTDSTAANRMYKYRVRAENATGNSTYRESGYIRTTPAAPTNVSAKQSGNNIVVNWKNNHATGSVTYVETVKVRFRKGNAPGEGSYEDLVELGPNATSYTHSNPGGGYYTYNVRVVAGARTSSYNTSSEVRLAFAPAEPTNASVVREADSKLVVTWTNHPTTNEPYDNIKIQRWDNVTGSYYDLATIAGTAESYTDTTTLPNRKYKYRIRSVNTAGNSGYIETPYQNTTPAKPTNAKVLRVIADILITWDNTATNAENIRIQKQELEDEEEWGEWGEDIVVAGDAIEYLDTDPVLHGRYRLRAEAGSLATEWVVTSLIATIQPPAAPTHLNPDNAPFDATKEKIFTWRHNTIDGTEQSKYSLRYRQKGDSWPATPQIEEASEDSKHIFTANTFENGKVYEWQVRTWGIDPDPSAWSNTAVCPASSAPTIMVTSPKNEEPYLLPELTVTWIYQDAEEHSQTQQTVVLYDHAGKQLERQTKNISVESGETGSASLSRALRNGGTYKITVIVKDSTGMESELAEVEFIVEYATPPVPQVELELIEEEGSINITVVNEDPEEDQVEAIYNNVYRSIDGGEFELIFSRINTNTTVTDYIPTVGGLNSYYVEAYSELPSLEESEIVEKEVVLTGSYFLNAGAARGEVIRFRENVSLTESIGRDTVLRQFAGREYPVKFQGEALLQELSLSAETTDRNKAKEIAEAEGEIYYRDWQGRRFTCAVTSPKLSKIDRGFAYKFDCTITRTEGED